MGGTGRSLKSEGWAFLGVAFQVSNKSKDEQYNEIFFQMFKKETKTKQKKINK